MNRKRFRKGDASAPMAKESWSKDQNRTGQGKKPSSRLCVKNIPKYADQKRVAEFFGKLEGVRVTDTRVLKTASGQARQLAFIGFRNEQEASKARDYFDKTYFDTCRLNVSFALPYGDTKIGRSWSKHTRPQQELSKKELKKQEKKKKKSSGDGKEGPENAKLAEFLKLMQPRSQSQFWANDDDTSTSRKEENKDGEEESSSSEEEEESSSDSDSDSDSDDNDDDDNDSDKNKKENREGKKGKKRVESKENENEDTSKNEDRFTQEPDTNVAADTGRLFVRNLPFSTTETELEEYFAKHGKVSEVHIPVDQAQRSKGFGFVEFMLPENALLALAELDGEIFQGRLLHVMPAASKPEESESLAASGKDGRSSSYKEKQEAERKKKAENSVNWNTLFVRGDAAIQAVAKELGVGKSDLLLGNETGQNEDYDEYDDDDARKKNKTSAAVRMALSETRVIAETKKFLKDEGVNLETLEAGIRNPSSISRSKTCLLVKNLPAESDKGQLTQMFEAFGDVEKFIMPPSKTMALVSFYTAKNAKRAFRGLAYKRYKQVPIYLEWAPSGVLKESSKGKELDEQQQQQQQEEESKAKDESSKPQDETQDFDDGNNDSVSSNERSTIHVNDPHTLFVKNLSFDTQEDELKRYFESKIGKKSVIHCHIPKKKKRTADGKDLSMGYGFIEFSDQKLCKSALRKLQGVMLDGHRLELKLSQREVASDVPKSKRRKVDTDPNSSTTSSSSSSAQPDSKQNEKITKLVIRNLAFEANRKELRELAGSYGQVNTVRIPRKMDGTHRGFAFVDFVTHQEAKAAFKALSSTHLYGRHLVIEWAKE